MYGQRRHFRPVRTGVVLRSYFGAFCRVRGLVLLETPFFRVQLAGLRCSPAADVCGERPLRGGHPEEPSRKDDARRFLNGAAWLRPRTAAKSFVLLSLFDHRSHNHNSQTKAGSCATKGPVSQRASSSATHHVGKSMKRLSRLLSNACPEIAGSICHADTTCWPLGWVVVLVEDGRRTKGTAGPTAVHGSPEWPQGRLHRRARAGWRAACVANCADLGSCRASAGWIGARSGALPPLGAASRRRGPCRISRGPASRPLRAARMVRGLICRQRHPGIPYNGLLKNVPQLA